MSEDKRGQARVQGSAAQPQDVVGEANGGVDWAADGTAEADIAARHRKHKKAGIITGVVVAAVVVAGVGLWNWHATPGFCGTACHYSMNAYTQTYEQAADSTGVDKYGNDVSNTNAMLAVSHQDVTYGSKEGLECLDCHVPSISQQLGEVRETLSGDYYAVGRADGVGHALVEVDSNALIENAGGTPNTGDEFCLRSGCHVTADGEDYTRDTLTELTSDMEFNPHRWTHGYAQCTDCHKSHRASVFYCTRCHADAYDSMPDGWVSYDESQQILDSTYVE